MGVAQDLHTVGRKILFCDDPASDGVVDIMINVSDPVAGLHDLSFRRKRRDRPGMVQDPVTDTLGVLLHSLLLNRIGEEK